MMNKITLLNYYIIIIIIIITIIIIIFIIIFIVRVIKLSILIGFPRTYLLRKSARDNVGVQFELFVIGCSRDSHVNYARFNGFLRNVLYSSQNLLKDLDIFVQIKSSQRRFLSEIYYRCDQPVINYYYLLLKKTYYYCY